MFEQTFVTQSVSGRKPWTVAVSLAGQLLIVGASVLIPLLHPGILLPNSSVTIYAPKPPSRPVEIVQSKSIGRASSTRPRVFVPLIASAPTRVPSRIAMIEDAPLLLPGTLPIGSMSGSGPGPLGDFLPQGVVVVPPRPAISESAKPKSTGAIRVASTVQGARLLHEVKPLYPPLARAARVSGTVRIHAIIAKDGAIRDLQLIGGPPLLVDAALNAVKQWVYRPTLLNGEPVEVITQIDVNFILGQ